MLAFVSISPRGHGKIGTETAGKFSPADYARAGVASTPQSTPRLPSTFLTGSPFLVLSNFSHYLHPLCVGPCIAGRVPSGLKVYCIQFRDGGLQLFSRLEKNLYVKVSSPVYTKGPSVFIRCPGGCYCCCISSASSSAIFRCVSPASMAFRHPTNIVISCRAWASVISPVRVRL